MRTIAVCNQKGGVAKTTTAVNLAAILAADHKRRVLVVDADAQANATSFLGGMHSAVGMAALLRGELSEERPLELQRTNIEGVALVSGSAELMDLDLTAAGSGAANINCLRVLRRQLEERERAAAAADAADLDDRERQICRVVYGEPFDYCLIDCPPAFNAASSAALIASDEVIIPLKVDAFAVEGMTHLLRQIQNMRKINPRLRVLGLLPVMWYRSDVITRAERALRESGLPVLPHIRRSDRVDDMTFREEPLIRCSPKCGACQDYRLLAKRIEKGERTAEAPSAPRCDERGEDPPPLREHNTVKKRGRPRRTTNGKEAARHGG